MFYLAFTPLIFDLSYLNQATAVKKVLINPSDREAVTNVKRSTFIYYIPL